MPPPEARMRHRSSKYVSTARPSLEVRSVMALHWSWKEVRRRIVPAGAGVCKIARMSLPVPLVRAVALPIPLLSIRFQLRPFARHSCARGTAGGPRRRFRTAIGWESLACYSSGTCQAAWPSVSVSQRSAAGIPCAPGSCSWPVRVSDTPRVVPRGPLGRWRLSGLFLLGFRLPDYLGFSLGFRPCYLEVVLESSFFCKGMRVS